MWLFEHFREATKKIMTPPPPQEMIPLYKVCYNYREHTG